MILQLIEWDDMCCVFRIMYGGSLVRIDFFFNFMSEYNFDLLIFRFFSIMESSIGYVQFWFLFWERFSMNLFVKIYVGNMRYL